MDLGAGQGQKRGEQTSTRTEADSSTQRRAQVQVVEAGGLWVHATSRWAAIRTGRGGGGRVKIERSSTRNGYGWGGRGKEGEKKNTEKRRKKRWGGRAKLKSNNKRRSLGPKRSMYEVGTPLPHI